jgi:non-ribosomal peptide synthetase component F
MLTPIGCVGELLIEGPNVARGYVNEPEKTKAAFIENPAWMIDSISSSHRIYKTGDLVRYEADGNLTIVGRKDSQVKFNGLDLFLYFTILISRSSWKLESNF